MSLKSYLSLRLSNKINNKIEKIRKNKYFLNSPWVVAYIHGMDRGVGSARENNFFFYSKKIAISIRK